MNKRTTLLCSILTTSVFLAAPSGNALANTAVNITVRQGARQTFQGFGASQTTNGGTRYANLAQSEKNTLQKLVCNDIQFKIARLWFDPAQYASKPGEENISKFVDPFVSSEFISTALANGCNKLLLAPGKIPEYMGSSGGGYIHNSQIKNYAALLANFIYKARQEYGVKIHATGVLNEPNDRPIKFSDEQWPIIIKNLRKELDNRGLKDVKIIGPELANADGIAVRVIKAIKQDPEAWKALDGISTHSYNMAATNAIANLIEGTDKEYWMTEAGTNGPENPGDALNAASAASRFLNDMNHRVTHWIWFIGHASADPRDDATRLIRYSFNPFRYDVFQKYYYFLQLSKTFDLGAVFRKSISSLESNMTWTNGKKPRITVASAKNPDGSWGIAVSNFTDDRFEFVLPNGYKWSNSQGGYAAEDFSVTVFVEELAQASDKTMRMYRSNSRVNNVYIGDAVMRKGKVSIPNVKSLDLITLRSK
jgi:O-glycosyl hydrolase